MAKILSKRCPVRRRDDPEKCAENYKFNKSPFYTPHRYAQETHRCPNIHDSEQDQWPLEFVLDGRQEGPTASNPHLDKHRLQDWPFSGLDQHYIGQKGRKLNLRVQGGLCRRQWTLCQAKRDWKVACSEATQYHTETWLRPFLAAVTVSTSFLGFSGPHCTLIFFFPHRNNLGDPPKLFFSDLDCPFDALTFYHSVLRSRLEHNPTLLSPF